MDVVLFCFTEKWWDWERWGFAGRTATIARRLAAHPAVSRLLVVDSPTGAPARVLRDDGRREHLPVPGMPWLRQARDGVFVLDQTRLLPGERLDGRTFAANGVLHDNALVARVHSALDALDMRDPVSWLAGPTVARYALAPRLGPVVVYDAVDEWAAHPSYRGIRRLVLEGYDLIRREADLVFAVTPLLARRFTGGMPRVCVLPNAADGPVLRLAEEPSALAAIPRPRAGYVGALQDRLDVSLIEGLAHRMPDVSFVFVGPVTDPRAIAPIEGIPNIHLAGPQPTEDVPAWLHGFDACLLPHRDTALTRNMDPVKLYEYIAAGRPVVSSPLPGLTQPPELVRRASTPDEWERSLREAIHRGAAHSSAGAYSAANTWDSRLDLALDRIAEAFPPRGSLARGTAGERREA